jgi:predicted PurR-regulated permease PerM
MGQWLIPFVIALILAYAFHVPLKIISEKLHVSRSISAWIIIILLIAGISLFSIFFIPLLKRALVTLVMNLPSFLQSFPRFIDDVLRDVANMCGIEKTFDVGYSFKKYLAEMITSLPNYAMNFMNVGIKLVYIVMFVFMTPIITFYLLRDWDKIEKSSKSILERMESNSTLALIQLVNVKLAAYIKGQMLVCVILSIIYTIGLMLIGTEEFIVCGVFSGVFSIAPFFGAFLGFLTSLVMSFDDFTFAYQYVAIACLFVVIPFIDSNFITPKLIGKKTSIQPVWLLFSICATVSILGVAGIFISVPLAVILSTVCKETIRKYS